MTSIMGQTMVLWFSAIWSEKWKHRVGSDMPPRSSLTFLQREARPHPSPLKPGSLLSSEHFAVALSAGLDVMDLDQVQLVLRCLLLRK